MSLSGSNQDLRPPETSLSQLWRSASTDARNAGAVHLATLHCESIPTWENARQIESEASARAKLRQARGKDMRFEKLARELACGALRSRTVIGTVQRKDREVDTLFADFANLKRQVYYELTNSQRATSADFTFCKI